MRSEQEEKKEDKGYRLGQFNLLQLMMVVGVLGILVTWVLQHFW